MNIIFLSGTIIDKPKFKFTISNNKSFKICANTCICYFKIKLEDSTTVKIIAYNELAEYCFKALKTGDFIMLSGTINDSLEIIIDFCQII